MKIKLNTLEPGAVILRSGERWRLELVNFSRARIRAERGTVRQFTTAADDRTVEIMSARTLDVAPDAEFELAPTNEEA